MFHLNLNGFFSTKYGKRHPRKTKLTTKRRENGENVNPISEHRLVSSQLGRAMNWVDRLRTSAD